MADSDGYYGVQRPEDDGDEYNALVFVIKRILDGRHHAALVKVTAVEGATVDVQPLVNQLDGQGNAVAHGVVNDIPFVRVQGGTNAIIIDPQPGDIGICLFCDRDSSSAQATKGPANPGSLRRSDMADGVYLGGLLNGEPTQYVSFTEDGIKIVSPTLIHFEAPKVEIVAPEVDIQADTSTTITTPKFTVNGASQFNGTIDASDTVTAPDVIGGGKSVANHFHIAQGPTSPTTPPKP